MSDQITTSIIVLLLSPLDDCTIAGSRRQSVCLRSLAPAYVPRDGPAPKRQLRSSRTAHVFADLAFVGHQAVLPPHEAIDVLDAVGRSLPAELL